ncbi:MAG: sugar phosphate isomerase/epimerase family protein [Pirellulaceae bacterium]
MVRFCMNEMTTFRWSFEEDVQQYVSQGIRAISVWRPKLSDYGEDKGIELLQEAGLEVASLLWAGGFTGSDGRSYRECVTDAKEAIRVAAAMKADCLLLYSGPRGGHTINHARRLLRNALRDLLPLAEENEVTLALEPMHEGCAADWTFLTDVHETIGLINEFASPRLRLAFDTYHFGFNRCLVDRIAELVPAIAIVQLGDGRCAPQGEQSRCRLGEGVLPLQELVANLLQAGYRGYFDVELMGEEIENGDYRELLQHSKSTFEGWCEPQPESCPTSR